jgi:iron complex transport system substrate-binding protein
MNVERTQRELPALQARPEWAQLRAVKAGRVLVMDGEKHVSTPGPGVADGAELLARWLRGR